jgi:hypothetical protein
MRYARVGGLSDERRQLREVIRMRAAEGFALGELSSVIAKELWVRLAMGPDRSTSPREGGVPEGRSE